MKTPIFSILLLLLVGCSQVEPQKTEARDIEPQQPDPNEVQLLIDKTYKDMIFVKGGSFMMGDPVQPFVDIINEAKNQGDQYSKYMSSDRNQPIHKVTLDSFYMAAYEVTYDDYDVFTNETKQPLADQKYRSKPLFYKPQKPVGSSWDMAHNFCLWLAEKTGQPFDLPTEAQWEYAARNRGQNIVFATDTGLLDPGRNFSRMDIPVLKKFPEEVGLYAPNPMGFYNLSDNAAEWVKDWYSKDYYQYSPENNPKGPETGNLKVLRGGGLTSRLDGTTVARGVSDKITERSLGNGFRCVINTDEPLPAKE